MEKLLIVQEHQADAFERKCAEMDIIIFKKNKSVTEPKFYYEFNVANDVEMYYLVNAMGLLNELETAHKPEKELLN